MSYFSNLRVSNDSLNYAARLPVASETIIFDAKHLKDKLSNFFDEYLSGAATSVHNTNLVTMSVTSGTDTAIRKTFMSFNYFSGVPINYYFTFSNFESQTSVVKEFGCFSAANVAPYNTLYDGVRIYTDDTTAYFSVNRGGTLLANIPQSAWLNGGDALDLSKGQVFKIQYLWLGFAGVKLFAEINGNFVLIAKYKSANVDSIPFFNSPNKPIRYGIRSTGGAGTFNMVCSSVAYENSLSDVKLGSDYNISTDLTPLPLFNNTGTRYIAGAIRLKSTHLDMSTILGLLYAQSSSNDDSRIEIWYGGTPSAALTFTAIPNRNVEVFIAPTTATITHTAPSADNKIGSRYFRQSTTTEVEFDGKRRMGATLSGVSDVIYIVIIPQNTGLLAGFSLNLIDL